MDMSSMKADPYNGNYRIEDLFGLGMDRRVDPFVGEPGTGKNRINLGHGAKLMPRGVVSVGLPEWNAETDCLPFDNNSIAEIWALHFMEHIQNVTWVLLECQRVLEYSGTLNIVVPYGVSHCAIQDITHKHRFNEDTWKTLFSNPYYDPLLGESDAWKLEVQSNFIMGIKGENLSLFTQLVKED